jgi:hypothetical protein
MRIMPLTPWQRNRVLALIYRELLLSQAGRRVPEVTAAAADAMESHLDALVGIVRRSTAQKVEPYLVQILDEICPKCQNQTVSGYCPLRHSGECLVYGQAAVLIKTISRVLGEIPDPHYWGHTPGTGQ